MNVPELIKPDQITGFDEQLQSKLKFVACGANHSLMLDQDGNLYAMGKNNKGQLGVGPYESTLKPERLDLNAYLAQD